MALSQALLDKAWSDAIVQDAGLSRSFTKPDLKQAVSEIDAWVTGNAPSFNQTLSEPFKSGASPQQKALLLAYICLRRAGL